MKKKIIDLTIIQLELLVNFAKKNNQILIDLFELITKETRVPIQLPFNEQELKKFVKQSKQLNEFLKFKYEGIKNSDLVMGGIYVWPYKSNELNNIVIGVTNNLQERQLNYIQGCCSPKIKTFDLTYSKSGKILPFVPILFYSIPYTQEPNQEEKSLQELMKSLEALMITVISEQTDYILLNSNFNIKTQ